jgi:hypothetical protein
MRFEYKRNGKKYAVLHIDGHLEWPALIIDRVQRRVEITCDWDAWIETGRFLAGFEPHVFILDGVGRPYTLRYMRDDGRGVPVLSTEPLDIAISCDELIELYRASRSASGMVCGDFSAITTFKDFATRVLDDHEMTV